MCTGCGFDRTDFENPCREFRLEYYRWSRKYGYIPDPCRRPGLFKFDVPYLWRHCEIRSSV
jgi:hypothetical protein